MAFIKTTPAKDATGETRAMYERQQSAYGYVPNYAKVFCHRPEVLSRWGRLLAEIRRPMDDRLFELATFTAAVEFRHSPCSLAHGKKLAEIIGDEPVQTLAAGSIPENFSEADAAVVRFARKLAHDASSIGQDDLDALKTVGFSDAQIFDIAAAAAGRSFFTKLLDALGVELDADVRDLDASFRTALMVGRKEVSAELDVLQEG